MLELGAGAAVYKSRARNEKAQEQKERSHRHQLPRPSLQICPTLTYKKLYGDFDM
jgi:hypothetical protein